MLISQSSNFCLITWVSSSAFASELAFGFSLQPLRVSLCLSGGTDGRIATESLEEKFIQRLMLGNVMPEPPSHCSPELPCTLGPPRWQQWQRTRQPVQETQEMRVQSISGRAPGVRKWQPTPVCLPEKSHGWRSLVGYSPRGRKELDTTERLNFQLWYMFIHQMFVQLFHHGNR